LVAAACLYDDIIRADDGNDEWADAANIWKEISVTPGQGQSWQGVGGQRYPTEYPGVPEPVNYRAGHAGRHAPDRTGAPNGKCLTRVYQMGRHDAVSVIVVIASSCSYSGVKCDDSLGMPLSDSSRIKRRPSEIKHA